jgi:dihydroxy-acid dehydratase
MNAIAETFGVALPGSAVIPAPYRKRAQMAYKTGVQTMERVYTNREPPDIMTLEALENAVVVNTATGGSTNASIYLNAIAKQIGVPFDFHDWGKLVSIFYCS